MHYFKSFTITLLISVLGAASLPALTPNAMVSAESTGVDNSECVKTKSNDCKDNAAQASNASGGGAAGNSSASEKVACDSLDQLGGTGCGGGQSAISNVASRVVSLISYLAGIIAVIMLIISGVKYTTSGGDSNKVSSAKTTLIYALVGIVVAALAQVLVHFVLQQSAGA